MSWLWTYSTIEFWTGWPFGLQSLRALLKAALFLGVVAFFPSCFRAVLLDSDTLANYADEDIVVSTKDGLRYRFAGGDYEITVNANGERVIKGEGKVYRGDGPEFDNFSGNVLVSDIERITTSETTPFLYISLALVALLTWLAISFARFGGIGG